MRLREASFSKLMVAVLSLAFCLIPALMVETAGTIKPPAQDCCDMHCWAQWRQCLGHCNRPGAPPDCESTCWTTFDICLWCCDEGPNGSLQSLEEIFINMSEPQNDLFKVFVH